LASDAADSAAPRSLAEEVDDDDAAVLLFVSGFRPTAAFERELQPRLFAFVLALLFFPFSDLLDDERR
jgi:hypothetical protein